MRKQYRNHWKFYLLDVSIFNDTRLNLQEKQIKKVFAYLWHNIHLQVNAKDHRFNDKHSLHPISGNPIIVQILNKRLPPFFNTARHQFWPKCKQLTNILTFKSEFFQVINLKFTIVASYFMSETINNTHTGIYYVTSTLQSLLKINVPFGAFLREYSDRVL
jgi:hypothetical protein